MDYIFEALKSRYEDKGLQVHFQNEPTAGYAPPKVGGYPLIVFIPQNEVEIIHSNKSEWRGFDFTIDVSDEDFEDVGKWKRKIVESFKYAPLSMPPESGYNLVKVVRNGNIQYIEEQEFWRVIIPLRAIVGHAEDRFPT